MEFTGLLNIMREDDAFKKAGLDIEETKIELIEVPQQTPADKKPENTPEEIGMEDYSDQELNGPKAKPKLKNDKTWKEVPDKDTQNPKPKAAAKENKKSDLYLCNACFKTFRSNESKCTFCSSELVEKVVKEGKVPNKDDNEEKVIKTLTEGVLELVGEMEELTPDDNKAVRDAVESGKIPNEWPTDDEMIDALSSLEDFVDPSKLDPDEDVKMVYLKMVLVPKAISLIKESINEEVTIDHPEDIANLVAEGLQKAGYWHTETKEVKDAVIFEFITTDKPKVLLKIMK